MPKVSVIIPTYNCSRYLPEAIDSVLGQTYKDFEIVVVDDGSTDNTPEIVSVYVNRYPMTVIRYYYQKNKGPGAARNKGIVESKGDYLAFLDSDDVLLPDSLGKRCLFLDEYPEAKLVFTDYYVESSDDAANGPKLRKNGFKIFFEDAVSYAHENKIIFNEKFYRRYLHFSPLPIWTGTVMLRRECFHVEGLFRTDISIAEDCDYWFRIIKRYKTGFIDAPLSCYRHSASILTKQKEKSGLDTIRFYNGIYSNNKENEVDVAIRKRLSLCHYCMGHYYKNENKYLKAGYHLLKSVQYSPSNIFRGLLSFCSLYSENKRGGV